MEKLTSDFTFALIKYITREAVIEVKAAYIA
jgi:hypothetical protein